MSLDLIGAIMQFFNQNQDALGDPALPLPLFPPPLPSLAGPISPSPFQLGPMELQQQLLGDNPLLRLGSPSPGTFMIEPRVLQDMMPVFEQLLPFLEEFKRQGVPTLFPRPGEPFDVFTLWKALERTRDLQRFQ